MKREVSAAAPHSKRAEKSPRENATRSVRSVAAAADDDALALQLLHLPRWREAGEADAVSRDGFGGGTVQTVEVVGKGGGAQVRRSTLSTHLQVSCILQQLLVVEQQVAETQTDKF